MHQRSRADPCSWTVVFNPDDPIPNHKSRSGQEHQRYRGCFDPFLPSAEHLRFSHRHPQYIGLPLDSEAEWDMPGKHARAIRLHATKRPGCDTVRWIPLKNAIQGRPSRSEHADAEWHNGADLEIHFYAESLQGAAKLLIQKLDQRGDAKDAKAAWEAAPIILLYRQAIELALKVLVGEGVVFLKKPTDRITLYKTHSLLSLKPWTRFPARFIRTSAAGNKVFPNAFANPMC